MSTSSQPAYQIDRLNRPAAAGEEHFPGLGWYVDQRLWMQDPSTPGNIAHNYALAFRIHGQLDRGVLERSFFEVLRRHRVLRSAFSIVDGKLTQRILSLAPVTIPVVNLISLSEDARKQRIQSVLLEEGTRQFDLSQGPVVRLCLLRLDTDDHILSLTTHHVVCDDWSTGIVLSELFTIYNAFRSGDPSPLPELNYHYAEFSNWLQERLDHGTLASRFTFWKERLGNGNDFHHVTPDHPRSPQRTYRGTHAITRFSGLAEAIKSLALAERVTPFMTMFAALGCLLHHYSGSEDIGIGSCVANRPLAQTEQVVGPFGNVVVIRTDFSGNPTLREILRRVRTATLRAYSFQDLPFGTLVDHLQPLRDPSRNPLFQTLLVFRNAPTGCFPSSDLIVEPHAVDTGTTRYELNLWLTMGSGLELDLQYNSDLFQAETIKEFTDNYRGILQTLVDDPDQRLSDLQWIHPITSRSARGCTAPADRTDPYPASQGKAQLSASAELLAPVEQQLLQIWKSVLGIPEINIRADFFTVGGDSLRAARLLTRIEQQFGQRISMESLITAGTIQQQAQAISRRQLWPMPRGADGEPQRETGGEVQLATGGPDLSLPSPNHFRRKGLIRRGVNRFLHLLCRILPGGTTLRPFLHRLRGVQIGKNVWIGDDVYLENEYPECVELQDGAMLGMRSTVVAHTRGAGKVVIGKDAFVGVSCVIVTSGDRPLVIGEGAVIMASTQVSGSVAPHTLYGSNTAKPLALVGKPFTGTTSYQEFIASLTPLRG